MSNSGDKLKKIAMQVLEGNYGGWLKEMRKVARREIKKRGYITIDPLRRYAVEMDIPPANSNVWGAVFRPDEFVSVGFKKSEIKSNKSRYVQVWGIRL